MGANLLLLGGLVPTENRRAYRELGARRRLREELGAQHALHHAPAGYWISQGGPEPFQTITRELDARALAPEGPPFPPGAYRSQLARLALMDRVVLILPAWATDWWALGVLFGLREARTLRLAVLITPEAELLGRATLGSIECLPGIIDRAELVTEEPARIASWLAGSLYQDLMKAPVEEKRRRGGESSTPHDH